MEIDKNLLKKAVTGAEAKKGAMIFQTNAPLDDRFVVRSKYALISKSAFTNQQYLYQGMVVSDRSTGEAYILKTDPYGTETILQEDSFFVNNNENYIDSTINKHWKKLASDSDLQNIKSVVSGIFQFKGIATAIDPDHTSLTIGQGTININGEDLPLISWGTFSRNIFNQVMYAWGTEQGILIYTEDPYISDYNSKSQKFYIESGEMTSQYITVFDTIYVNNQNTVNVFDEWIDSQGNLIYTKTDPDDSNILDIYPTSNPDGTVIAYVEPINYTYHNFEEDSTFYDNYTWTVDNLHQEDANSENNGHVYQIGEEEYASNGNMWVQLGSPKTDWIVL